MSRNRIPFLDLVHSSTQLKDELVAVVKRALATAGFIGGPMVDDFEREFAGFCDTRYWSAWPAAQTRCGSR